ncbi:MAG: O-antigen ligase domain-containing protein [Candidatus Kapaibacterium sp.]|nr:MAG: O-antigen ligase domain-containing protein [Candidatus Kapabacteria bacterium]
MLAHTNTSFPFPFANALPAKSDIRTIAFISLAAAVLVAIGLLVNPILAFAPLALGAGGLLVAFFVRYPRVWLCLGALLNYWWISQGGGDEEITLKEYALVLFYFGGLAIWFFGMCVIQKRRVVRHWADKILLLAIAVSLTNAGLAVLNGTPILTWVREWLLFWMILYYFPWREHFTEKRHIQALLACHAVVFLAIGGQNLYNYLKASTNMVYAYQIWASRKTLNTHIFMSATVWTVLGGLYAAKRKSQVLMMLLAGFYGVVVVASFSRGFWLSGILALVVCLAVLDPKKLVLFSVYGIIAAVGFTLLVQLIFPDKATFIFNVLKARLLSSSRGTSDVSLLARYYETMSILNQLQQYFLGGNGLGSSFYAYDPIQKHFFTATFIHNGYIFVWLKLGFFFFVSFYSFWFATMIRAYQVARQAAHLPMAKILAAACAACFTGYLFLNITSSMAEGRDGFYCLSMCCAALGCAENLLQQKNSAAGRDDF